MRALTLPHYTVEKTDRTKRDALAVVGIKSQYRISRARLDSKFNESRLTKTEMVLVYAGGLL
ncbi:hypothetical protein EJ03DRAFT_8739 [Teratosphaeria nubilosa]|uniref:Uncharacterized protein n=1 Tax=Teratosphaeria nubilosa TaxID=161662 RepID=A0A6G1LNN1_9PEZI|nr:hypothetical protein EJ03DRAFT_8739 [Teratosphaeria nubilosa]